MRMVRYTPFGAIHMNVTARLHKMRQTACRTLRDPLGIRRFKPSVTLEAEDLPGMDRENRIRA